MSQQTTTSTAPAQQGDPTGLIILLVFFAALILALPGLLVGVITSVFIRGRRGLYLAMVLLALLGGGLIYLWHREIWVTLLAGRDVVQGLIQQRGGYQPVDLWSIVQSLWSRTWPVAPAVAVLIEASRKPTEAERDEQERKSEQQRQVVADKAGYAKAAKAPESIMITEPGGKPEPVMVIGAAGPGDAFKAKSAPQWAIYPRKALNRHGVIIGESGKGKSELLLRLAYGARKTYGWRVYCLDAKGNPRFADEFRATMIKAGVERFGMFPNTPMDGWRGNHELVYNKLIASLDFSEPYYKNTVETAARLAVFAEDAPPRSGDEFLSRFDIDYLLERYANDPSSLRRLKSIKKEHIDSAYMRFDALFSSVGQAFNGKWSYEDVDAGYFLLDAVAKREQARTMGRFLIEDFAQAITNRIPPGEFALFLIDEYPALAGAGEAAKLFEQVRSPHGNGGAGVFVTGQSYAALGEDADRMIQAANATICFQQSDTNRIAERAGQRIVKRKGYSVGQSQVNASPFPTASAPARRVETFTQREEEGYLLSPDAIRRLEIGQCYIIPSGNYQKVTVSRVPLSEEEIWGAHLHIGPIVRRSAIQPLTYAPEPAPAVTPMPLVMPVERPARTTPPEPVPSRPEEPTTPPATNDVDF